MLILALALLSAAAGLLLLTRGLKGRAIDDHPICTNCGFDAVGLTPRPDEPFRCPECGVDLRGRTRIGNRKRLPRTIAWGAALLILGTLICSAWIAGEKGAIDWASYKPLRLLRFELARGDWPARKDAAGEVERRSQSGKLSPQSLATLLTQLRPLAETRAPGVDYIQHLLSVLMENPALLPADHDATIAWILSLQADRTKPWSPFLGDCVENDFLHARLDDKTFLRFMEQSFQPRLVLLKPDAIPPAQAIPVLVEKNWRSGTMPFKISTHVDGMEVRSPIDDTTMLSEPRDFPWPLGSITAQSAPGPQTVAGSVTISLDWPRLSLHASTYPTLSRATINLDTLGAFKVTKTMAADLHVAGPDPLTSRDRAAAAVAGAIYVPPIRREYGSADRISASLWASDTLHELHFSFDLILTSPRAKDNVGSGTMTVSKKGSGYTLATQNSSGSASSGGERAQLNFSSKLQNPDAKSLTIVLRVKDLQIDGATVPLDGPLDVELRDIPIEP